MISITRFMTVVLAVGVCPHSSGVAQQTGDQAEILLALASHLTRTTAGETAAIDPRFAARVHRSREGTFEGDIPAELAEAIAQRLGAQLEHQANVFVCAQRSPSSCAMRGASVFIKITRPLMPTSSEATVWVDVMRPTDSKTYPVEMRQREIKLVRRRDGAWTVVSDREIAAT